MKKYIVTWFNWKKVEVSGENVLDAIVRAGYDKLDVHDIRNWVEVK